MISRERIASWREGLLTENNPSPSNFWELLSCYEDLLDAHEVQTPGSPDPAQEDALYDQLHEIREKWISGQTGFSKSMIEAYEAGKLHAVGQSKETKNKPPASPEDFDPREALVDEFVYAATKMGPGVERARLLIDLAVAIDGLGGSGCKDVSSLAVKEKS